MRNCNPFQFVSLSVLAGMILYCALGMAKDAADGASHGDSATGESDDVLLKQAKENQRLLLGNQHLLGGTRILMGASAFVFSALPYGIAQIVSGAEMANASDAPATGPDSNSPTLPALIRQNRLQTIDQQRWVGRTRIGLGGMLLVYGLAGTAGAAGVWFGTAYDRHYVPLAIGATILDVGFYVASIRSFGRGRRDIAAAREMRHGLSLETDPARAVAENQRLITESQKRIGALRIAMGASVLVIASMGAAATVMTWMLPKGFERNVIGTLGSIGTLGAAFMGGYLLVTGVRMRKGAKLKTATIRPPRFALQPVYIPRNGIYSAIGGISLRSEF
ncbi:MAG: hypothetical protein JXX14_06500 [Deltaproteobacteria bacterium]|nr:hypothetical protein [Deltaproteobacteria bacterium]